MKHLLQSALLALLPLGAAAQADEQPIITLHSDAYKEIGETNKFSFLIGAKEAGTYIDIDFGAGKNEIELEVAQIADGEWKGTWIPARVDEKGIIKVYGDPTKIDVLVMDGAYITDIDMAQLTDLEILSLEHNALRSLDLTPFTKLQAIYLNDNPFTAATPLVIGTPKPDLQILEMTIMDHVSPQFNLSDYPALAVFDAYHNFGIDRIDPTGCPELRSLCLELTNVESVDVSKNPKLTSLNVAETRVKSVDISNNPNLLYFMGGHLSGTVNTGYKLESIDLSHNPNLIFLSLSGNALSDIDLSANTYLQTLSIDRNRLTGIDLSKNVNLYSVSLMLNDMDYATLPLPQNTWGEYYYSQNALPVNRALALGSALDLSARVLREGTTTSAKVWRKPFTGEPVEVAADAYTYADGIITFSKTFTDSVYVEFSNDVFSEYTLRTSPFMVKTADEIGKPSLAVALTADYSIKQLKLGIGLNGASAQSPRKVLIEIPGLEEMQEFTVDTQNPEAVNVVADIPANFSGRVNVYMPEGEALTAFHIDGTTLYDIDVTKATELRSLTVSDAGLYSIDLRYNRCLSELNLSGNQLTSLDLKGIYGDYEKNVLTSIDASRNSLTALDILNAASVRSLNLSANKLTEFPTTAYANLEELDLSDNQLSGEVSLTYQLDSRRIDLSGNPITSLKLDRFSSLEYFDVSSTSLSLATLPLPADIPGQYVYSPLTPLQLGAKAPAVNLTEQNRVVDGKGTDFVWKKADGTVLTNGVDVDCTDGGTRFLKEDLGAVYCEMTNPAFPGLVYRTTEVEVVGAPTVVVATFTTEATAPATMIVTGSKRTSLYVDWRGDGTEFIEYPVATQYTQYPVNTFAGCEAKVYTYDDPTDITVFSLYEAKLSSFDATPMTGLTALSVCDAGLTADQIKMPAAKLTELKLSGNELTDLPWSDLYPDLYSVELANNLFEQFDASQLPKVGWLVLSGNLITSVKFNNANLWNVSLDGNRLSSIDLNGLPALEQLFLQNNLFETIDLSAVSSSLRVLSLVGNRFTFATLPSPEQTSKLFVYYYGNQARVNVECQDGEVDLSAMAEAGGYPTAYIWYLGEATYDADNGVYVGETLAEGDEFTVDKGITTFHTTFPEKVMCVMTNPAFPNLMLETERLTVDRASIAEITADGSARASEVYDLAGRRVVSPARGGIYIVGGRKTLIR